MNAYVDTLSGLHNFLQTEAGGRTALLIHLGAILVVLFVVGKLLARIVFRSDAGYLAVVCAGIIPMMIGTAAWAAFATWWNPQLFEVSGLTVATAMVGGLVAGLIVGALIAAALLKTASVKALVFIVLVGAASAGGILVSKASLTVFGAGAEQVEKSQQRMELGN